MEMARGVEKVTCVANFTMPPIIVAMSKPLVKVGIHRSRNALLMRTEEPCKAHFSLLFP